METRLTTREPQLISDYENGAALSYEPTSPIRQVANYSIPVGFSSISAAIAYFLTHEVLLTILASVGVFLIFGLVWAIREIQVTRKDVHRTQREIRKNSVVVRELGVNVTQSVLSKGEQTTLPAGMLELYIQYKTLNVNHLEYLLRSLDRIYKIIYGISQVPLEQISAKNSIDSFIDDVEALLRGNPDDRLLIATISTGESIKLRCKTGWLPSFSVEAEGDIAIAVPKGMLALIVSASLLGGGVKYGVGIVKEYNEIIKTQEEIQNIRDARRKEREEAEKLRQKVNQSPPEIKSALEGELNNFLDLTTRHNEILGVKVQARGSGEAR